jgi:glutathione S-transferase
MKLFASATSPFARKVRIALIELGLAGQATLVATNSLENPEFRTINPLAKVPALELDDGTVVYDSGVIVEYLDALDGRGLLIPRDPFARVAELRRHALADGILDAEVSIAFELRRPTEQQSTSWIARWKQAVTSGAGALAGQLQGGEFGLAGITAAVAVDYVAFRLPDVKIPALAAWRQDFAGRASLERTHPARELVEG